MDLISSFDPSSSVCHHTLMMICMLTGYTFCVPLKTKTTNKVEQAYVDEVYTKCRGSMKLLSENRTEFKNQLLAERLPNWMWNVKFIPLLTILNPMEELKDSIFFKSMYV